MRDNWLSNRGFQILRRQCRTTCFYSWRKLQSQPLEDHVYSGEKMGPMGLINEACIDFQFRCWHGGLKAIDGPRQEAQVRCFYEFSILKIMSEGSPFYRLIGRFVDLFRPPQASGSVFTASNRPSSVDPETDDPELAWFGYTNGHSDRAAAVRRRSTSIWPTAGFATLTEVFPIPDPLDVSRKPPTGGSGTAICAARLRDSCGALLEEGDWVSGQLSLLL